MPVGFIRAIVEVFNDARGSSGRTVCCRAIAPPGSETVRGCRNAGYLSCLVLAGYGLNEKYEKA